MAEELTAEFPESTEDFLEPADAWMSGDESVAPYDTLSVVQAVLACMDESEEARRQRDELNQINFDAYHCRQDNSGKMKGQSREFLPKTPMALEQFAAFIRKGVSADDYFSVEVTPDPLIVGGPLSEAGIVKLMRHRLEDPSQIAPGCLDFPTTIEDGVKTGGLGASFVAKVCGRFVPTRRPVVRTTMEPTFQTDPMTGQQFPAQMPKETLEIEEGRVWRLCVELVRPEDYYPDPTGRGLYEIEKTRLDLHEVIERSEGDYPEFDPEAVRLLAEEATHFSDGETEAHLERETDQPTAQPPSFRKEVEVLTYFGTILDSDGSVAVRTEEDGTQTPLRNVRCSVANRKYLIRRPEPNPYWHQESGFVAAPLLRVPFSTFHKALFDHAVRLNIAQNELFNLMLDGGIGSVWGVRQIKLGALENPEDFDDGIPQGAVLKVKDEFPDGQPAMQQLATGVVPPDAIQMYQLLDREFASATMLSDTAKGMTPRKDVSATAVASADQATSLFFDSIIAAIERNIIEKILRLAWLTMLQNCDDWNEEDVVGCIGPDAAQMLQQMSPAKRYATYAQGARFKVHGVSTMVARTREFQKIMSFVAAIAQNPILMQTFFQNASPQKLLNHLLQSLNLNPEDFKMTPEEQKTLLDRQQELGFFMGGAQGAQGMQQQQIPGVNTEPGSPTQQAQGEISQMNNVPQGL